MIRPIDTFRRWWHNGTDESAEVSASGNGHAAEAAEPAWLSQLDRAGVPRSLVYPTTTLGRVLDQSADRFGSAPAIVYGSVRWTYRELLAQVNRTAGGLASLGVRRGDRVLFTLPNCPEFVTSFLAVQKLGALAVNVGPLMGADDLATVVAMTTPRVAIGLDLQAPSLAHAARASTVEHWVWVSLQSYQTLLKRLGYQYKLWHNRNGNGDRARHVTLPGLLEQAPARPPTVEPDPDKPAVLQATGGTTGTLKLAQLSHHGLLANAIQVMTVMSCRQGQDRFLAALPMFHAYGLTTSMLVPIVAAAEMVLMTRFNAGEALELLRRERLTVCPLVPAMCAAICDELEKPEKKEKYKPQLAAMRLCFSGAAPLPPALGERFSRLTGAAIAEGYGLTEASPVTHVNLPNKLRAGSIGLPLPDTDARIVKLDSEPLVGHGLGRDAATGEPGELFISGPQLMLGYFANPQQSQQSLIADERGKVWLRTGDIARMDEDGYFYILDRKKDMIIRSGLKIFPAKVEQVLRRHPRVADVAVVGRADPVHTEIVVAVLVLNPPTANEKIPRPEDRDRDRQQLVEELRALCREHLARYEVPQQFEFLTELPRSPLGKLLKRELRKQPALEADNSDAARIKALPSPDALEPAARTDNGHDYGSSPNGKPDPRNRPKKQEAA